MPKVYLWNVTLEWVSIWVQRMTDNVREEIDKFNRINFQYFYHDGSLSIIDQEGDGDNFLVELSTVILKGFSTILFALNN